MLSYRPQLGEWTRTLKYQNCQLSGAELVLSFMMTPPGTLGTICRETSLKLSRKKENTTLARSGVTPTLLFLTLLHPSTSGVRTQSLSWGKRQQHFTAPQTHFTLLVVGIKPDKGHTHREADRAKQKRKSSVQDLQLRNKNSTVQKGVAIHLLETPKASKARRRERWKKKPEKSQEQAELQTV